MSERIGKNPYTSAEKVAGELRLYETDVKVIPVPGRSSEDQYPAVLILSHQNVPEDDCIRVYRGIAGDPNGNVTPDMLLTHVAHGMRRRSNSVRGFDIIESARPFVHNLAFNPSAKTFGDYLLHVMPLLSTEEQTQAMESVSQNMIMSRLGYKEMLQTIHAMHVGGDEHDFGIAPYVSAAFLPETTRQYAGNYGSYIVADVPSSHIDQFSVEAMIKEWINPAFIRAIIPFNTRTKHWYEDGSFLSAIETANANLPVTLQGRDAINYLK